MVNVVQTAASGASSAAQYARASAATAVLATEPVEAATVDAAAHVPADQAVAATDRAYRYNSFEFSYRQDFGKIVLIRQKPDTGELVQQFPSEYYLRKYADSQRVALNAAGGSEQRSTSDGAPANPAPSGTASGQIGAAQPATPSPAPAPAPSVPSAPALPSAAVSGGGSGAVSVNLTV